MNLVHHVNQALKSKFNLSRDKCIVKDKRVQTLMNLQEGYWKEEGLRWTSSGN